jgi:dolichol-phosphate mannosyltransferase
MAEIPTNKALSLRKYRIAVIIPAYKVEREIENVLTLLPKYILYIIVVNDASPDRTGEIVMKAARRDKRIILLTHDRNQGVGGAMVTGFKKAIELEAQLVVKLDGDGQMNPDYIPALIAPLIQGKADYTKGNRFRDFQALEQMPLIRRIGNTALSFFSKAATGYWNCFDPTNGYIAIRGDLLRQLPLSKLDPGYYFEISLLSLLYFENAFIKDIPMPALYRQERSNLSIAHTLIDFSLKLPATFFRRILIKYFLNDFSMLSIYLLSGIPLLAFGLVFGIAEWVHYAALHIPAPTGTVMLATLPVILGIQVLLSAIGIDLQATPKAPDLPPIY